MGPRLVSLFLPRRVQVLARTAITLGCRRSCTIRPPRIRRVPEPSSSLIFRDPYVRNDLPLPSSVGAADLSRLAHSTTISGLQFHSCLYLHWG
ncbi:hypothetical protein ONZ51_g11794 [Trametes cubensis]|uniref:Uncharacterized protein n=1 Tax=Trametes cubensis TaxID=1111947 RepID=A0AAD7THU5_9APHY|nr:hypothetical protein ONZ51_g11794 [Trametes cubensis]